MNKKKCKNCSHWEKFDGSYIDYGECKESSPVLISTLLLFRTNFFSSMSPVSQRQATLWPTTKNDDYCDKWND